MHGHVEVSVPSAVGSAAVASRSAGGTQGQGMAPGREEMDPNSETESEPSVDVCEAARIAFVTKNGTQVLCPKGC